VAKRKLLDVMPHRYTEWIDEPDGTISITTHQDVESILDQNKSEYNSYGDHLSLGKRGEWHKVASIPFNVYEQWKNETNGAIQIINTLRQPPQNCRGNKDGFIQIK